MLRLPEFRLVQPDSLGEVIDRMVEMRGGARLVAGGTDLMPRLKNGIEAPEVLISLSRVAGFDRAEGLAADSDELILGAGITLDRLEKVAAVSELHGLAEAVAAVATPHVRRAGTLGGNLCQQTRCSYYNRSEFWRGALGGCMKADGEICQVAPSSARCWAVMTSDLAPPLIALDASVAVVGPAGDQASSLEDYYRDDGLAPIRFTGSVLASVRVPRVAGRGSAFEKLRTRDSVDFASASAAVALRRSGDLVEGARVILGGVASAPVRAASAEEALSGAGPEVFREAAITAAGRATPVPNSDLPAGYRKQALAELVWRCLDRAWQRAGPGAA